MFSSMKLNLSNQLLIITQLKVDICNLIYYLHPYMYNAMVQTLYVIKVWFAGL